jgi:hypothetical protein
VRVLSTAEVLESFAWLATLPDRGTERADCDGKGLFFTNPEASCIDAEYPMKLERMPFLARYLATIGYESGDFKGALLWFNQWEVWNRADEAIGYRLIEAMNIAAGQPKAFEAAPGHSFRADELPNAIGMLLQPMIFGWDATYLPRWSYGPDEFFLHVSHDSFLSIVTRTRVFYDKVFGLLESVDLQPKAGHESRTRRFCRA